MGLPVPIGNIFIDIGCPGQSSKASPEVWLVTQLEFIQLRTNALAGLGGGRFKPGGVILHGVQSVNKAGVSEDVVGFEEGRAVPGFLWLVVAFVLEF